MIRVAFFVFAGAVLFVVVTGLSPWFFIIPVGLLALGAYTVGGMKLKCPNCGKRIKLGYSTCHHCGREVGAASR